MNNIKGYTEPLGDSVIPRWMTRLSFQQQSVLLLALRGPDGVRKNHPAKPITIAYRATILRAAERQRFLSLDPPEAPDSFMAFDVFADPIKWEAAIKTFFAHVDELPHHYVSHIAHAAQIIAVHHDHPVISRHWGYFYATWCEDLHVNPETPTQMDNRLSDWGTAKIRLNGQN